MEQTKKRFWWIFACLNLLSIDLMANEDAQSSSSSTDSTHTNTQSQSPVISPRRLPASVAVAFDRDMLENPTNLSWQGKDTPLHSGDVAKSMLSIPGFSMARKGGGGSEIAFRSQSASRLPIFLNGGYLNGACGGRMDTTVTYVFPENYNRITILKGPQDVRYAALIGGGVLFDRDILRLEKYSFASDISALYGSFGRMDANANVLAGGKYGSLQAIYSHYESKDYRDGSHSTVHSAYKRESASLIGTLTPTSKTALEASFDIGRGNASYADRGMDARTFDRISYNLNYKQAINDTFESLEVSLYRNEIDHIMDNFSYRSTTTYNVNNPKRTNTGGRIEGRFYFNNALELSIGGNYNHDDHASRVSGGQTTAQAANDAFSKLPYNPNFTFKTLGVFAQGSYMPGSTHNIAFGARYDNLSTLKHSSKEEVSNNLGSGFVRYEKYLDTMTLYSGVGVAQRGADFWERNNKIGGMTLKPETNTQLDIGLMYSNNNFNAKASAYASYIADYIVLDYTTNTTSFNTNALLGGGELEAEYIAWKSLHFYGSLAYTYAENLKSVQGFKTHAPLPQIPPLQGSLSAFYEDASWLLRLDLIANATQYRYTLDYGNVVGKDLGKTKGFATLNLYGGYKHKYFMLLAGVDNLTNTLYAYHLSKNGFLIGDIPATTRVNEPGRSYWVKLKLHL